MLGSSTFQLACCADVQFHLEDDKIFSCVGTSGKAPPQLPRPPGSSLPGPASMQTQVSPSASEQPWSATAAERQAQPQVDPATAAAAAAESMRAALATMVAASSAATAMQRLAKEQQKEVQGEVK